MPFSGRSSRISAWCPRAHGIRGGLAGCRSRHRDQRGSDETGRMPHRAAPIRRNTRRCGSSSGRGGAHAGDDPARRRTVPCHARGAHATSIIARSSPGGCCPPAACAVPAITGRSWRWPSGGSATRPPIRVEATCHDGDAEDRRARRVALESREVSRRLAIADKDFKNDRVATFGSSDTTRRSTRPAGSLDGGSYTFVIEGMSDEDYARLYKDARTWSSTCTSTGAMGSGRLLRGPRRPLRHAAGRRAARRLAGRRVARDVS